MTGGLTEEERLLQATARDFATRELAPTAIERDETERYDRALFTKMGELGLTAAPLPEAVGGPGSRTSAGRWSWRSSGAADMSMAVSLSVHILSQYPVVTWGSDEQRGRWLPAMLAGEALGAFGLTEPHAGSDAAAIRTRAERVGPADAPTGLPPDRDQDLDLQRARGRALPRLRDARSRRRPQGDHRVPRREGDARVPVRGAREEDGDPRLPGGRAHLRRGRGAGRQPSRRRGRGLQDRAVGAGGGPDLDRRGVRRDRARRARGSGARMPRNARRSACRWRSSRACGSCWPRWRARSRRRGP